MALARGPGGSRREWLVDARDDGRRMELTWHRRQRLVVLSLWQGGNCRATFRLPVADAPEVIALLSNALGDAAAGGGASASSEPAGDDVGPVTVGAGRGATALPVRGASGRWQAVLGHAGGAWQRLRGRRRSPAEVVDLTTYRAR